MKVKNLKPNELSKSEKRLIAPCGIYCGACDLFLGKSRNLAKKMHRILNGFNMADVGPLIMGIERERVEEFLNILRDWSQGTKCPGCLAGGGIPSCPVKTCAQQQGFLTCAECAQMPCHRSEKRCSVEAATALELVTKRYSNWNIANLERIKEVGYRCFIEEMQQKVRKGFLTSDVISSEMVVSQAVPKTEVEYNKSNKTPIKRKAKL